MVEWERPQRFRRFARGTTYAPHQPGAGTGERRSGDVAGAGARQDRAAARVPALESEWSLPRGEGDPTSFSTGRGLRGLGQGLICRTHTYSCWTRRRHRRGPRFGP